MTRDDTRGPGAGVRLKSTIGPHRDAEITVIESSPERIVETGRGGKGMQSRTRGTYTLSAAPGGGTDVTFTLEMEPATLAEKLQAPAARIYMRKQNARAMERLRELMEARAPAA
jgi:Polyketide cyclase / dehydrase and lipid transport